MKPEECKGDPVILPDDDVVGEVNNWFLIRWRGNIFVLHGKYGEIVEGDFCDICGKKPPAGLLLLAKMEGYKE